MAVLAALPLVTAALVPSASDLGKAEGECRPNEQGPALLIEALGLKDHTGNLKAEVYPPNDHDFLQDDNILVSEGKTFRRVEVPVPATEPAELCIRVPAPGRYSVVLLHDRDRNGKFNWSKDGVGFAGNPKLGWSKPKAARAAVIARSGITRVAIVLNYRHGLGMAPLKKN